MAPRRLARDPICGGASRDDVEGHTRPQLISALMDLTHAVVGGYLPFGALAQTGVRRSRLKQQRSSAIQPRNCDAVIWLAWPSAHEQQRDPAPPLLPLLPTSRSTRSARRYGRSSDA
jgi:hypothetical protein